MRKLIVSSLALIATAALAQQDFSNVEIRIHPVSGAISMLEGAGGNIGVSVGEDGIVIIDDQYAPLAPKIKAALHSITDQPVRFVLNTHYHGDHTGGNEVFGETAPIIAHENVRKRLAEGGRSPHPAPEDALPVITFREGVTIHLNGEEIRAVHFPRAHTDGDSVIFFDRSNVVHMGDLFFNGLFPFIDIDGGGSINGLIAGIESILPRLGTDTKIIPGHGPLATPDDLRKYLQMLRMTRASVAAGLQAGKTAAQMKDEKILAEWESWSWAFVPTDRFIDTLVRELEE